MLVKNATGPLEAGPLEESVGCGGTPHSIRLADEDEQAKLRAIPQQQETPTTKPPSKGKSSRGRPAQPTGNHKLTEYFPVRRSVRKCKRAVLEEKQRDLENKVLRGLESGLEVRKFTGKGRGVVTTKNFAKGEFVVEYKGNLIDHVTAKKLEAKYAKDNNTGCYMYYFQYRNQHYCVDATAETNRLGRLVNHSRNGNLITRIVEAGYPPQPHLVLIAKEDIPEGVEVCYDYGDRNRESIRNHPWLAL
ncbi:hypothetical protein QAD02_016954 [Eretmocerus hayati]|uniref:Uncharacterized protein n=1 Tax=Eretmocerus hayati TaxID=131215 RepID=A0ACC2PCJ7_9HYME|nr:hypothetical protein QAD02_016954 [Eretmocerus hayati]